MTLTFTIPPAFFYAAPLFTLGAIALVSALLAGRGAAPPPAPVGRAASFGRSGWDGRFSPGEEL